MGPVKFGKYTLLEKITTGGMAEVFRGVAIGPGGFARIVAIKKILPCFTDSEEFLRMFQDEAAIAARLNHANIAQVYDFDIVAGIPYLAMEFVEGKDVRCILKTCAERGIRLPWPLAVYIALEVAKGLFYVHSRRESSRPLNIVHRDVSPQNIMVSRSGEVKLVDFGIARAMTRQTVTFAGRVKGKYAYMSPEQVSGQTVDHRSDIFSLGVVLWEMLTLRRLFAGENDGETIARLLRTKVPPCHQVNPEVPERLSPLVLKALSRQRSERYPTMLAFHEELSRVLFDSGAYPDIEGISRFVHDLFPEEMERLAQGEHLAFERPEPSDEAPASPEDRSEPVGTVEPGAAVEPIDLGELAGTDEPVDLGELAGTDEPVGTQEGAARRGLGADRATESDFSELDTLDDEEPGTATRPVLRRGIASRRNRLLLRSSVGLLLLGALFLVGLLFGQQILKRFSGEGGLTGDSGTASTAAQPGAVSPDQASGSSQPSARSPDQASGSPQPSARSPDQESGSSQPSARSPDQASGSSQPSARSPDQASGASQPSAASPGPAVRSPGQKALSLRDAAASLRQAGEGAAPAGAGPIAFRSGALPTGTGEGGSGPGGNGGAGVASGGDGGAGVASGGDGDAGKSQTGDGRLAASPTGVPRVGELPGGAVGSGDSAGSGRRVFKLAVRTDPSDARIWIGSIPHKSGVLEVEGEAGDEVVVKLTRSGYAAEEHHIVLEDGYSRLFRMSRPSRLKIYVKPPRSEVLVEGRKLDGGRDGRFEFSGRMGDAVTVEVAAKGYVPQSRVVPLETREARLSFELVAAGAGKPDEKGAPGFAPKAADQETGKKEKSASQPGSSPASAADDTGDVVGAKPAERGYLTINAEPYAAIRVDGKRWGDTPVNRRELPEGRHTVVLYYLEQEHVCEVTVEQGKEARCSHRFPVEE